MIAPDGLTLGIIAGGAATRLQGRDKAWLQLHDEPLVQRLVRVFAGRVSATWISANRDLGRYAAAGLLAVPDRVAARPGPLAGIDALLAACPTPWLLTVPVDLLHPPPDLPERLHTACGDAAGAYARDDDGPQPLAALWRVAACRTAVAQALADGDYAVHRVQAGLGLVRVDFVGLRFGNLNTPEDLARHGIPS